MILVIAEKPSVAQTIAAVLGAKEKKDGFLTGSGYIVSWCVGHLVGLAEAAAYGEQYKKWSYDSLPILPQEWKYTVSADKEKQFKTLKELMHRADVSEVVNACDAGREGELIFRFTAEWENNLTQIAKGKADPAAFMEGIENMARELVKTYAFLSDDKAQMFKPEREAFLNHIQFAGHIYLSSFSTSEISFAVAVTIRMPLSLISSRRASSCRRFVSFWVGVSKRNWSTDIL